MKIRVGELGTLKSTEFKYVENKIEKKKKSLWMCKSGGNEPQVCIEFWKDVLPICTKNTFPPFIKWRLDFNDVVFVILDNSGPPCDPLLIVVIDRHS